MPKVEDLLTLNEAAEQFGISYQTISIAAKKRRLRVAKWVTRGKQKEPTPLLLNRADVERWNSSRGRRSSVNENTVRKAAEYLGIGFDEALNLRKTKVEQDTRVSTEEA